jgi:hypothetical protein
MIEKVEKGADGKDTVTFEVILGVKTAIIEMREGPPIVWDGGSTVKQVEVGASYSTPKISLAHFPKSDKKDGGPFGSFTRDVTYTTRTGNDHQVRVSVEIDGARYVGVAPRSVTERTVWYLNRVETGSDGMRVLVFEARDTYFEIKQQPSGG